MPDATEKRTLDVLMDSWDRNNAILVGLLRVVPEGGMAVRAGDGSPTVGQMFNHIHYVRLVFLSEDAPEFALELPTEEWATEQDRERLAAMLNQSAAAVAKAVRSKVEAGTEMKVHYDHPILMMQHMIWHDGYHHGQIKLALKLAGLLISDDAAGPVTWDVWMDKSATGQ